MTEIIVRERCAGMVCPWIMGFGETRGVKMRGALTHEKLGELGETLRQRLRAMRDRVVEELRQSDNERYVQLADRVHDTGDESVADLLADVNLLVIDQHIREIKDIDAALLRIATHAYGACIDCGTDIEYERLKAYPTAERCLSCQSRHERSHLQPHRPTL
jgi:DnaK suppressor protein